MALPTLNDAANLGRDFFVTALASGKVGIVAKNLLFLLTNIVRLEILRVLLLLLLLLFLLKLLLLPKLHLTIATTTLFLLSLSVIIVH